MNSDQKLKATEEYSDKSQVDVERKTRRSSILKPQKPRNPFTTLDFSEPNPDNTFAKAARRVSFASSNSVKPFVADPEKNTIWDTTYEEEINHTDSTKSSYEQTSEAKSNDFLNLTSIYSPESVELEVSLSKICEKEESLTKFVVFDKENLRPNLKKDIDTENLNSFVGQNNMAPLEHTLLAYSNQTMDFTLVDKENVYMISENITSEINKVSKRELSDTVKHDLSLITPFNETISPRVHNIPSMENTKELINIINKENFNPIINDMTLVTHIDKVPKRNIGLKSDRAIGSNTENNIFESSENRLVVSRKFENRGEQTITSHSSMELNKPLVIYNTKLSSKLVNNKDKTVYFTDDEVDFTKNLSPLLAPDYAEENVAHRKTIYMDESYNAMELTSNLQCLHHIPRSINTSELKNNSPCKNETVYGGTMDYTVQIDALNGNTKILGSMNRNNKSNRKTIYFNEFEADVDITMPRGIIHECKIANDVDMTRLEGDMELTNNLLVEGIHRTFPEANFTVGSHESVEKNLTQSGVAKANSRIECVDLENVVALPSNSMNITSPELCQDVELSYDLNLPENGDSRQRSISNNNSRTAAGFCNNNIHPVDMDQKVHYSEMDMNVSTTQLRGKISGQGNNEENKAPIIKDSFNVSGVKRHYNSETDSELAIKRKTVSVHQSDFRPQLSDTTANKIAYDTLSDKHSEREMVSNIVKKPTALGNMSPAENELSDASQSTNKANLQTSTLSNSNILYSEPMKIKLKSHNLTAIPDLCDNLNLQSLNGSLNLKLHPTSTPATSFHMTLTDMSPCIEDTQQLIYATFSKPEVLSLKECTESKRPLLLSDKEKCSQNADDFEGLHGVVNDIEEADRSRVCKKSIDSSIGERTFGKENVEPELREEMEKGLGVKSDIYNKISEMATESAVSITKNNTERSCYIDDESQVDLNEFSDLSIGNSPKLVENVKLSPEDDTTISDHTKCGKNSTRISDPNNYTVQSQLLLSKIDEFIQCYEMVRTDDYTKLVAIHKQSKKNSAIINNIPENIFISKCQIIDLEEKHKLDEEENASNINESASNSEDDKGVPSTADLIAPKSLYERICEAAGRCKAHWKFVKSQNDEYCFFTLFGSLPFKVHVNPHSGIVFSVKTSTNLIDEARHICWYELKLFRHKLEKENLLAVLGAKFDILTLLDYVNMTMEEIINFHLEYIALLKKYGVSHHFRMNRDLSITFEVINIEFIVHWIITVRMSPTTPTSIESIKCASEVGEKVNEDDIKCIAENTPKGTKFLSNFIENVNDYVKRMEKKFRFRRHKYV